MAEASVTVYHRLEPRPRSDDPSTGLEACTADPLWLFARQWQLGESHGGDPGPPIPAPARPRPAPLTRWQPGPLTPADGSPPAAARDYDRASAPLEQLVE